ncbi:hypothetical protein PVAP13_1NG172133 [Panicum virgatum]|uniref:Uncharacterized protein n=1 Tax=Panicum virgatum TaxID=38727 RepID=A0A8T0WT03_PANVG|nr:hypothetical protein PVAP13_1NG172133 [Panicum virgatum]
MGAPRVPPPPRRPNRSRRGGGLTGSSTGAGCRTGDGGASLSLPDPAGAGCSGEDGRRGKGSGGEGRRAGDLAVGTVGAAGGRRMRLRPVWTSAGTPLSLSLSPDNAVSKLRRRGGQGKAPPWSTRASAPRSWWASAVEVTEESSAGVVVEASQ